MFATAVDCFPSIDTADVDGSFGHNDAYLIFDPQIHTIVVLGHQVAHNIIIA